VRHALRKQKINHAKFKTSRLTSFIFTTNSSITYLASTFHTENISSNINTFAQNLWNVLQQQPTLGSKETWNSETDG